MTLPDFTPKYWMIYNFAISIAEEYHQITINTRSREQCIQTLVQNNNCSVKCYPVYFNILPNLSMCLTYEDYWCMSNYFQTHKNLILDQCFRSSFTTKFPEFQKQISASPISIDPEKIYFGDLGISFDYISPNVEVKRERYTITTQDFIGSVGGSLGLFMGFSFFAYTNAFLEKLFQNLAYQEILQQ